MTSPTLPSEQNTRGLVTFTPCELTARDTFTERGLAAANGANPDRALTFRDTLGVFAAFLVCLVMFLLSGCVPGQGVKTARDVARVGCALLQSTDGTSADVLDRMQELQRAVLESAAQQAAMKGMDADRLKQAMHTLEVLAEVLRKVSLAVVQEAGNSPVALEPEGDSTTPVENP